MDERERPKESRAVFLVREISCSTCGLAIEKQVKKLDGVKDVGTAVMLNKVFVDFDPSRVSLEEIRKAVHRTGYGAYLTLKKR
ncbi:MAG TPA: heavy-metal-associated domain-containing protein [Conexivisphaerales archaeon]|nr:heavy-metal-associated domain-containing protein [Conexivisphaerales archaeon]